MNDELLARQALRQAAATADPRRVRRTQRVVREHAMRLKVSKSRLAMVMLGCAMVTLFLGASAVPLWNSMDSFAHSSGIPDLQVHMLFLAVWFLPATIVALLLWRGQRRRVQQITRWLHVSAK